MDVERIGEIDIIIPALKIIRQNPGATTTKLISELEQIMPLSLKDKEILSGRGDSKFSQIVRNLVSHSGTNSFGKYTQQAEGRNSGFIINKQGDLFLQSLEKEKKDEEMFEYEMQLEAEKSNTYSLEQLVEANNRSPDKRFNASKQRYTTNPRITKTVLSIFNFSCELDKQHHTFLTPSSNPYMEGHHFIPMKAQEDFSKINIDRSENICCLCPNCHKALHYGDREEKTQRLWLLYQKKKKSLEKVKIAVDFEKLIYKYYA